MSQLMQTIRSVFHGFIYKYRERWIPAFHRFCTVRRNKQLLISQGFGWTSTETSITFLLRH